LLFYKRSPEMGFHPETEISEQEGIALLAMCDALIREGVKGQLAALFIADSLHRFLSEWGELHGQMVVGAFIDSRFSGQEEYDVC